MTATASRLPLMPPIEREPVPKPVQLNVRARNRDLQGQYDVLAQAFATTFDLIKAQAARIDALERKIKLPNRLAAVEEFAFVLPATPNAPARRCINAAGLIAAIAERQRG